MAQGSKILIVDDEKPNSAPYEGVTLSYIDLSMSDVAEPGRRGADVFNISGSKDLWDACGSLPGFYDVSFGQRPGKGGRPQIRVLSLEFVAPFAVAENFGPRKSS